jgi:hypothetical protein
MELNRADWLYYENQTCRSAVRRGLEVGINHLNAEPGLSDILCEKPCNYKSGYALLPITATISPALGDWQPRFPRQIAAKEIHIRDADKSTLVLRCAAVHRGYSCPSSKVESRTVDRSLAFSPAQLSKCSATLLAEGRPEQEGFLRAIFIFKRTQGKPSVCRTPAAFAAHLRVFSSLTQHKHLCCSAPIFAKLKSEQEGSVPFLSNYTKSPETTKRLV